MAENMYLREIILTIGENGKGGTEEEVEVEVEVEVEEEEEEEEEVEVEVEVEVGKGCPPDFQGRPANTKEEDQEAAKVITTLECEEKDHLLKTIITGKDEFHYMNANTVDHLRNT
jgi:hypothetical protein